MNAVGGGAPTPGNFAIAGAAGKDSLHCLHVSFKKSVSGNVSGLTPTLTFRDRVRTTYGPASDFDTVLTTEDPDQLGDHGMVATCDELSVCKMLLPVGGHESIELEARGDTMVDGKQFTATGDRITYDQAKGLLILAGTGRSDAVLYRQARPGDEREQFAARELMYWPKTGAVRVIDAKRLELGQPPSAGPIR